MKIIVNGELRTMQIEDIVRLMSDESYEIEIRGIKFIKNKLA